MYSFIIHRRLLLAYLLNCTQGREGGRQQQARLNDTSTQKYNTLAYVRIFQKQNTRMIRFVAYAEIEFTQNYVRLLQ